MYELNCVFEEILDEKSGDKNDGSGQWHSCSFRCSFKDGTYNNNVVFNSMYKPLIDRVLALKQGDSVKIDFTPGSSSWEKGGMTVWFAKNIALKVYKDASGGEAL